MLPDNCTKTYVWCFPYNRCQILLLLSNTNTYPIDNKLYKSRVSLIDYAIQILYILQHVVIWEHLTDVSKGNKVTPYWLNLKNCLVLYVCRSYFQFCFPCTNLISKELKKVSYERFRKWLSEVNLRKRNQRSDWWGCHLPTT